MNHYTVNAIDNNQIDWTQVADLWINEFPWYDKGEKQKTRVQMVHSDTAIHLKVTAWDEAPCCDHCDYGDPVYLDSCFEWFFSPCQDRYYINLEVNAKGVMYLAYGDEKVEKRQLVAYELAKAIRIKDQRIVVGDAKGWTLEIYFPKALIETIIGHPIHYRNWSTNFYRCGGKKNPQYATWHPIEHPYPQYHLPNTFGDLTFI